MAALAAPRPVKFTLAWLAQGSSLYVYVARAKGMMKARGIDLDIARGFGSMAAAQTIAGGQFEFGIIAAPPLALSVAKGLPLIALATCDYDSTMGVGVLADSPIQKPQDLAGKKIGAVPTSGEFPFFPAYAKKVGLDMASIELVHVDNKVLERILIERQVDAIMGFGSSSRLAAAYGVAVSGEVVLTTLLLYLLMRTAWRWSALRALAICGVFLIVDVVFFGYLGCSETLSVHLVARSMNGTPGKSF